MVTKNDHFITHMKLRELREQRTNLLQAYTTLRQQLAQEPSEIERLRLLYKGLRQIKFSHLPLHPDVANLEPLLNDIPTDHAALETISFWRTRLEQELASGQLRSEIVYLFGALLEEWTQYSAEASLSVPENNELHAALTTSITQPTNSEADTAFFDPLFSIIDSIDTEVATTMQHIVTTTMDQPIHVSELITVLEFICVDEDRGVALRQQAHQFLLDKIMLKELSDALTIMLTHIDEWKWPQEGIPSHIAQTSRKWRLFLDDDLPLTCFLEIVGRRWQEIFQQFFRTLDGKLDKALQYTLSRDTLNSFDHYLVASEVKLYAEVDIWGESRTHTPPQEPRIMNPASISRQRASLKQRLREVNRAAGYGTYHKSDTTDAMETALQLINAEMILGRTAFPDHPLHVIKVDLKDYYPGLMHSLLLSLLQRYGIPQTHLAFFQTFLQIPLQHDGQVVQVQRGIPNSRGLSDFLGELVLQTLDAYIRKAARVQIVRIFDDICILTPSSTEVLNAWQAIQRFCNGTGLAVNTEKCGAICINGERLLELPDAQPGWLMLTIAPDGQWDVNIAAFTHYVQQAREEIKQIPALLSKVEAYNNHLHYLFNALALRLPLGERHRKTVNRLLQEFQQVLFDEQQGGVETLRQLIRERFLGQASSIHIPEAWFYWPITAGGAGLYQVHILISGYNMHYAQQKPPVPPEKRLPDWQDQSTAWGHFYSGLFYRLEVPAPDCNPVMETLVADFIQRGAILSAGAQMSLATYWRWTLYLYGPQILQSLGTFRFLITELVPLQLIMKRYQQTYIDLESSFSALDELDDHPF